jgi:hypothetical protein
MLAAFPITSPTLKLDRGKLNDRRSPLTGSKVFDAIAIFLVWEHYAGLLHRS